MMLKLNCKFEKCVIVVANGHLGCRTIIIYTLTYMYVYYNVMYISVNIM